MGLVREVQPQSMNPGVKHVKWAQNFENIEGKRRVDGSRFTSSLLLGSDPPLLFKFGKRDLEHPSTILIPTKS